MKNLIKKNLVLLDSNFLLVPIQFNIDIYEEIENLIGKIQFVILKEVIDELNRKVQREHHIKFKLEVMKSIELLNQKRRQVPEFFLEINRIREREINIDDFIIEISKELNETANSVYIATNDKNIRKKAKEKGIQTIFMRQKKFLSL